MKQFEFNAAAFKRPQSEFGGSLLKNSHAKSKRPLSSKHPIHLVLRAEVSRFRNPETFGPVTRTLTQTCKKHGVRLYSFANVGNHIHMIIRLPHVRRWAAFIRELSGRLAQVAQGISGQQSGANRFWKQRPFTRIVQGWGRAYRALKDYVELNRLQAEGWISRSEISSLRELRQVWADG